MAVLVLWLFLGLGLVAQIGLFIVFIRILLTKNFVFGVGLIDWVAFFTLFRDVWLGLCYGRLIAFFF